MRCFSSNNPQGCVIAYHWMPSIFHPVDQSCISLTWAIGCIYKWGSPCHLAPSWFFATLSSSSSLLFKFSLSIFGESCLCSTPFVSPSFFFRFYEFLRGFIKGFLHSLATFYISSRDPLLSIPDLRFLEFFSFAFQESFSYVLLF